MFLPGVVVVVVVGIAERKTIALLTVYRHIDHDKNGYVFNCVLILRLTDEKI